MDTGGPNRDVEAGYLNRAPVIVAYLTQANDIHRISGALAPTRGSPVPFLAALPLHSDARRISDFDPDRARPRSIGAVHLLGHDALGAKPASVLEHRTPIVRHALFRRPSRCGWRFWCRDRLGGNDEPAGTRLILVAQQIGSAARMRRSYALQRIRPYRTDRPSRNRSLMPPITTPSTLSSALSCRRNGTTLFDRDTMNSPFRIAGGPAGAAFIRTDIPVRCRPWCIAHGRRG
jgi:hypothetical protein